MFSIVLFIPTNPTSMSCDGFWYIGLKQQVKATVVLMIEQHAHHAIVASKSNSFPCLIPLIVGMCYLHTHSKGNAPTVRRISGDAAGCNHPWTCTC